VHECGLIHKDIKPANILLDAASGGVWLTGFGIASRLPRERRWIGIVSAYSWRSPARVRFHRGHQARH
jgi:serine/threonine protein kinase